MRGAILAVLVVACSSDANDANTCAPDDADGIVGVEITVALTVNDTGFAPAIVKTQNKSNVTLKLTNAGSKPHGFAIDCLPTPSSRGCPTRSCFPSDAAIAEVTPGGTVIVRFATPAVEGIYTYRSSAAGDAALATGQFILQ